MENVLIYSANTGIARELLSAGRPLGEVWALALDEASAEELAACGVAVLRFDGRGVISADTAALAQVVALAVAHSDASLVLLGSDRRGKELTGRVAAALDAGCLTDVKSITQDGQTLLCTRLAFGGATISTESITSPVKVIAVSPTVFPRAEPQGQGVISSLTGAVDARVRLLSERAKDSDLVDLKSAEVIIAVGEGVRDEDFEPAQKLAQALGGVLACSKPPATDRGLLGEERVIGLSGVICKPQLALVIGVSGQVQFAVGIRDAKTIITINTNENADMVRMSDYFLVKDSGEAIAELCSELC
ncbi:MAG: electron transfer flavoprotein subunit alpha/FixB family protein [Coriobacteriia bacterium]|nr:electron transfer flavoprotein subunit alpha/FixB family protein [Coriobacteriia bacterium]